MSSSKFVSNLDGMNDGENFSKELLKVMLLPDSFQEAVQVKSKLHS